MGLSGFRLLLERGGDSNRVVVTFKTFSIKYGGGGAGSRGGRGRDWNSRMAGDGDALWLVYDLATALA